MKDQLLQQERSRSLRTSPPNPLLIESS